MGDGTEENQFTAEDIVRLIELNGDRAKGLDLSGKTFKTGIDLTNFKLHEIILNCADLVDTTLEGAGLVNAHLEDAHLSGANIRRANLWGANLRMAHLKDTHLEGAHLGYANLEKAKLNGAHLEDANLHGANLEGADLSFAKLEKACLSFTNLKGADLSFANLEGVDLFSAEFSTDTKMVDVEWGSYILDETQKWQLGASENSYRRLKSWYSNAGMYDTAGKFFYREMESKRKAQSWKNNTLYKSWLWIMRILCGYGERPVRVVISAAAIVSVATLVYFLIGSSWQWSAFWSSLYFSAVSFTALGYGSWVDTTSDVIRALGASESFLGVFMMALFLVTFTRKMTR